MKLKLILNTIVDDNHRTVIVKMGSTLEDPAYADELGTCVPFLTKLLFTNSITQSIYTTVYANMVVELKDILPDLGSNLMAMCTQKLKDPDSLSFFLSKGIGTLLSCGYERGLITYAEVDELMQELVERLQGCGEDVDMENVYCEVIMVFVHGVFKSSSRPSSASEWVTQLLPRLCAMETSECVHKRTQIRFMDIREMLRSITRHSNHRRRCM